MNDDAETTQLIELMRRRDSIVARKTYEGISVTRDGLFEWIAYTLRWKKNYACARPQGKTIKIYSQESIDDWLNNVIRADADLAMEIDVHDFGQGSVTMDAWCRGTDNLEAFDWLLSQFEHHYCAGSKGGQSTHQVLIDEQDPWIEARAAETWDQAMRSIVKVLGALEDTRKRRDNLYTMKGTEETPWGSQDIPKQAKAVIGKWFSNGSGYNQDQFVARLSGTYHIEVGKRTLSSSEYRATPAK